jgi:hypothetical protein
MHGGDLFLRKRVLGAQRGDRLFRLLLAAGQQRGPGLGELGGEGLFWVVVLLAVAVARC